MQETLINLAVTYGLPALVGGGVSVFGHSALLKRWKWLRDRLNAKADVIAKAKAAAQAVKDAA